MENYSVKVIETTNTYDLEINVNRFLDHIGIRLVSISYSTSTIASRIYYSALILYK